MNVKKYYNVSIYFLAPKSTFNDKNYTNKMDVGLTYTLSSVEVFFSTDS